MNVEQLKRRIMSSFNTDRPLAQDVLDTCETIDAARKDLFKKNGSNYVQAYENVWFVFLERIGLTVTKNPLEGMLKKPDYMERHTHKLDGQGFYNNVYEISFNHAYASATISSDFHEGNFTITDEEGVVVPISMIVEAVVDTRRTLKHQMRQMMFTDPIGDVQIHVLKVLLNTHYVSCLSENQRTQVGNIQADRFQTLKRECGICDLKVITGHVESLFVQGDKVTVEILVALVSDEYGYSLHMESHGKCLFENTRRYILNIKGQTVGYKFKENK